jgi:hypothetical protein
MEKFTIMEIIKDLWHSYWKNLVIAILFIIILKSCTKTQKVQLANDGLKKDIKISDLKNEKYANRINVLYDSLTTLEKRKKTVKSKIVTVIKEVEKKIVVAENLNTKGIANYYKNRYKLPVTITQYGVSLNDTIAKKNIVELIQKDGLVKELYLTKNVLSIEEKKGIIKDSIITNKSLIIVEKDNIIGLHLQIESNLNKSLKKEKVKKNIWKITAVGILSGSIYLLAK